MVRKLKIKNAKFKTAIKNSKLVKHAKKMIDNF